MLGIRATGMIFLLHVLYSFLVAALKLDSSLVHRVVFHLVALTLLGQLAS